LALLWASARGAMAEEFFSTRDQNPLERGFYVPLPSDTRGDAGSTLSATVLVSNTLNVESTAHESLFVDGESLALDLAYENAVAPGWRYRVSLPLVHDSGGVLDSVIDTWHELFGFPRGNRPYYPKRQIDYVYSGEGKIDLDHPQSSFGDLAADLGWYAIDDAQRTVSLWGGLKAPTGSVADLTSDGAWDGAVWALRRRAWAGATVRRRAVRRERAPNFRIRKIGGNARARTHLVAARAARWPVGAGHGQRYALSRPEPAADGRLGAAPARPLAHPNGIRRGCCREHRARHHLLSWDSRLSSAK
jgi:hypothetical protein